MDTLRVTVIGKGTTATCSCILMDLHSYFIGSNKTYVGFMKKTYWYYV